jgi:hypothetical protein
MGTKLVRRLHDPTAARYFSPATRIQLAFSQEITKVLKSGSIQDFKDVVDQCLERDQGWVDASRDALIGVAYGDGSISPTAQPQRRAFDLASQQRYQEAADSEQQAINAMAADPQTRGWLRQQKAAYLHPVNPLAAQNLQITALDDNRALLKPNQGIAYVRLKGKAGEQAAESAAFLSSRYGSPADLLIGINGVLADLVFDPAPTTVEPFEQGLADLGLHLGFASQRPEKNFRRGPDVLWQMGGAQYAVIEAKNNVVTDFIRKHDLGQLSVSMSWFEDQYDQPSSAIPFMFHRSNKPAFDAFAPQGTRVITVGGLERLKKAVQAWATALASDGTFDNPDRVGQQLLQHELQGRQALLNYAITTAPT